MSMSKYEELLNEGKTDVGSVDNRCSICGEELCSDKSMSGYYIRRNHFQSHGLKLAQARYAALKEDDQSIVASALGAFSNSLNPPEQALSYDI